MDSKRGRNNKNGLKERTMSMSTFASKSQLGTGILAALLLVASASALACDRFVKPAVNLESITTDDALDALEAAMEARISEQQKEFFACQEREAAEIGNHMSIESMHQQQDAANRWAADADQFLAQMKETGQAQVLLASQSKQANPQIPVVSGFANSPSMAPNTSAARDWRQAQQPPTSCAEVMRWCDATLGQLAGAAVTNERQQCAAYFNSQLRCPPKKNGPVKIDVR
jgi:hypothetical protein